MDNADNEINIILSNSVIQLFSGINFLLTLNLSLPKKHLNFITGSNGSGKTLVLKSLAYLIGSKLIPD